MQPDDIELIPDTGAEKAARTAPHPDDPHQIGSGGAQSPGGQDAPAQSASDLSQSGEGYPGARSGGETGKTGETPRPANPAEG